VIELELGLTFAKEIGVGLAVGGGGVGEARFFITKRLLSIASLLGSAFFFFREFPPTVFGDRFVALVGIVGVGKA
jgi:hypothetical protein